MKCKATKKDGTPCQRNAIDRIDYCYQHVNGIWNKITYFLAEIHGVKRRFLIWFLVYSIILFSLLGYANYQYTQILDNLKLKPNVEIELSPYLYEAAFGDYLPLVITNTGDFTLKNVHVFISTCEMLDEPIFENYKLNLLPAKSERIIPFANKETIDAFKKGNCYPFAGKDRSFATFSFNPFKIAEGQNYSGISTGCGVCFFNATVIGQYYDSGKKYTFKKKFRSKLDFPVDLNIEIFAP